MPLLSFHWLMLYAPAPMLVRIMLEASAPSYHTVHAVPKMSEQVWFADGGGKGGGGGSGGSGGGGGGPGGGGEGGAGEGGGLGGGSGGLGGRGGGGGAQASALQFIRLCTWPWVSVDA